MESRYTEDMVIRRCEKEKWVVFAESLEGRNLSALLTTCWNFSRNSWCLPMEIPKSRHPSLWLLFIQLKYPTNKQSKHWLSCNKQTELLNCWDSARILKSQSKVLAFQWIKETIRKTTDSWLIQHSSSGYITWGWTWYNDDERWSSPTYQHIFQVCDYPSCLFRHGLLDHSIIFQP